MKKLMNGMVIAVAMIVAFFACEVEEMAQHAGETPDGAVGFDDQRIIEQEIKALEKEAPVTEAAIPVEKKVVLSKPAEASPPAVMYQKVARGEGVMGALTNGAKSFDRIFGGGGLGAGLDKKLGTVTGLNGIDQFGTGGLGTRGRGSVGYGYGYGSVSMAKGRLYGAAVVQSYGYDTEQYEGKEEEGFRSALHDPLSTFSIDVDTASYANVRRFLSTDQLPPIDAVRIEELVNYFSYRYPEPTNGEPFSVTTALADCPWKPGHLLLQVGLKGKEVSVAQMPPANLTFLIDVSGSMNAPNKLPLLQKAFSLLVKELRPQDRVAITVYAGAAGLVLPPTPGDDKRRILNAIDNLCAGGSTAGAEGIELAYKTAGEMFSANANNRVILATDGDFNVGVSDDATLVKMIEEKRNKGIYLSVLGFGMGNYKDAKMEKLADKGNGNYAYIDGLLEAKKVFVKQIGGTLLTIAKDVKIQIEFNPKAVSSYRLIGYDNRRLAKEDFNDDKKDAGEIGAGHTVTAFYEIVPVGAEETPAVDPLRYQAQNDTTAADSGELALVKLRYKPPKEETSKLISRAVTVASRRAFTEAPEDIRFAAAVVGFGMLLKKSPYTGRFDWKAVTAAAKGAKGVDDKGYRAEFLRLVEKAELLSDAAGRSADAGN